MPCEDDTQCAVDADQQCCVADQCLNTCMIPCTKGEDDCPEANMGCEHDYCLFPCEEDEGCSSWPGYSCDNGGGFCEND